MDLDLGIMTGFCLVEGAMKELLRGQRPLSAQNSSGRLLYFP